MNKKNDLKNLNYYNTHAEAYRKKNLEADMSENYLAFEKYLTPGDHILDAGCGPGLHAEHFISKDFKVSGFDASSEFVKMCQKIEGLSAEQKTFQELDYEEKFDAIWSSASLLHVPKEEIDDVLQKLFKALKPGGFCYICVKEGEGLAEENGRFFTLYTQEGLEKIVLKQKGMKLVRSWIEPAKTHNLAPRNWINLIVKKAS